MRGIYYGIRTYIVWMQVISLIASGYMMVGTSSGGTKILPEASLVSEISPMGKQGPWTPQEEGDHFPCTREWWNIDSFFTSGEESWSVTASFEYEMETPACNMFFTLFDRGNGTCYRFGSFNDSIGTLKHNKNEVNLSYGKSTMKGLYPRYIIHLEDEKGCLLLDIEFYAETLPYWVAQNATNGFLPMGLGFYRYGFISRCSVEGAMRFRGKTVTVTGSGYYEHVWGNWSYHDPLLTARNASWLYGNLAKWWLGHHSFSLPSTLTFSRDNNPFGYDWIWASFDNNWSLFYGNLMFWVMEGPAFGVLYLEMDGRYIEFVDIDFKYGKMEYNEEYDVYYPLEIIVYAKNDNDSLSLHFAMTAERNEYIDRYHGRTFWKGLGLWESPGTVNGYYTDGHTNISLYGNCEIEPQRLFSPLGHNAIQIEFYPEKVGINLTIISHPLGVEIRIGFHLLPHPGFYFNIRRLTDIRLVDLETAKRI